MATMEITAQGEKDIYQDLTKAQQEGRKVLILTRQAGETFVFGRVVGVSRDRNNRRLCLVEGGTGPGWQKSTGPVEIWLEEIYRAVLSVQQEFDPSWRMAVGEMGRYWLIKTANQVFFGRIWKSTVMRNVLADGGSAEVADIHSWIAEPMFVSTEVLASQVLGVAEVFP